MQRRGFLKGSAIGAGIFLAGLGFADANKGSTADTSPTPPEQTPFGNLVEVPGTSLEVTDGLTKVPVSVTIGKFLVAPTEVTQREFEAVMGYNPSFSQGADLPVETVTWWEAIRYCNARSQREKLDPCYNLESGFCDVQKNGYRLPTNAEWEQAAGGKSAVPPAEQSGEPRQFRYHPRQPPHRWAEPIRHQAGGKVFPKPVRDV